MPHASIDASHRGALAKIRAVKTYVDDDDDAERDIATWLTCVGGEPVACQTTSSVYERCA